MRGGDCLVAFFEMPKGAKEKADRDGIAGMQHVSFAVTEERYREIRARIDRAGCWTSSGRSMSASIPIRSISSIRTGFASNSRIRRATVRTLRVVERWTQTKAEALAELNTLSSDAKWLGQVTSHLPDDRG